MTTGTGHEPVLNDQAAVQQVAERWLTGDRTAAVGRRMVLSITRYGEANRRLPTWPASIRPGANP